MDKSLKNISLVSVGNIFNAGLGFVFLTMVAKTLSISDFGKYALLTALLVAVAKITDFGTNSIYVAKSLGENTSTDLNQFLTLKVILFFLGFFPAFLLLKLFGISEFQIYLIFFIGYTAYAINFALFGFFQKLESFIPLILLNTLPALVKAVFAILLLFKLVDLNMVQAFMVFAFSIIPSLILYFWLPSNFRLLKLKLSSAKELWKQVLLPGTAQLLNEAFSAINGGIAKMSLGFFDLGIFSLADKISNIFGLVSLSIFTVLLPKNAQLKKTAGKYDFKETYLLAFFILLFAFCVSFAGKIIIPWFFENKFNDSLQILNVLVFASALGAIHSFMENYFYVAGKANLLAGIAVWKVFILVIAAGVLIPVYNIAGLAYAQFLASASTLGLVFYLLRRQQTV
ncbi:oligosaccharide flippase family protein [Patescibacteria group bacterium]|nr:oligosaccharide flippase family protein [Patescibacteria group bacterium]